MTLIWNLNPVAFTNKLKYNHCSASCPLILYSIPPYYTRNQNCLASSRQSKFKNNVIIVSTPQYYSEVGSYLSRRFADIQALMTSKYCTIARHWSNIHMAPVGDYYLAALAQCIDKTFSKLINNNILEFGLTLIIFTNDVDINLSTVMLYSRYGYPNTFWPDYSRRYDQYYNTNGRLLSTIVSF